MIAALVLASLPQAGELTAFKAAKVFTAGDAGVLDRGVVLVQGDHIAAVGLASELAVPPEAVLVDLGDGWLVPGMHEPHCHIAGSLSDLNDMVYLTNPELGTYEVVEPGNRYLQDAVAGGVTTALLIPGSGTNIGGFGTLVKTAGETVEESVVRSPGSLKVAQAGNPESYSFGVGRAMMNWNTRHTIERGLRWARDFRAGRAPWNPELARFEGLADGTVPVSVHTQIYQVVLMTVTMLGRDLGLRAFIDHGEFDGYKTGPLAVQYGVPAMLGPRSLWFDRSSARILGLGAAWWPFVKDGLVLGYNTDSPVVPEEELSYQACMGVRLGHDDPVGALHGITSNAAKALLCEHISGKLEAGLDADFAAWTGFPLDPRSHVTRVWIRGRLVYDAERDGRRY
ncbi:MAG: hypothetical protein EYC70_05425 [Planctomycetota bacterium]|nr:MAG: hypothetical protein EYC70_05425 [Planctomycetota bacterium]